ncbi:tRNA methyltransferase 10 homolog C [Megalops cyprinoides]|uniref:tRNA methyltransferase 10 homolog C n=1 Tax=Megalops cyprinoides TaxID=118141 RepID=UPI001863C34B|nr:tRNA methyltransferase 10 homolog C [Megalops cyprinoides]
MRFLRTSQLNMLWRNCVFKPPVFAKKQDRWQTLVHTFSLCQTRTLCTKWALRKEASQSSNQAAEKLDLDVWKSVMRSPGLQEVEEEKEQKEGEAVAAVGQGIECSRLEATRELVEMWRQAGKLVPEQMSEEELQTLGELSTKSSKKKYLKYLAIKECHKKTRREKKEKKMIEKMVGTEAKMAGEGDDEEEEEGGSDRRLKNTFLLHFWDRSMDSVLNWRAAQAMQFGQPLVFDMSYEQHMSRRELENTVSQLMESEGWNRRSADPFHLHFCNLQIEGSYHQELVKRYGVAWDRLLVTATELRHVDLFPNNQLVYLTADSPNVLRAFDHSKVYVVGSLVDKSIQPGLSLANAKRLKLATARLPLNEFLQWETGAKNLTLDQMIRILLTIKDTGSWEAALEFVPKRKHDGFYQPQQAGRSGTSLPKKYKTFHNRETLPNSSYKTSSVENIQARVRTALKTKQFMEHDTKRKGKKNWWEEE